MTEEPIYKQLQERPPVDTKALLRGQIPLVLTEILASGIMLGIYALLKKFDQTVCFGALLGTAAALLNHGVMILSLLKAEKAENPAKGQLQVRGMYTLRMIVLLVLLIFALKSGYFNVLATLLPLCFLRVAIFISELWVKKKQKGGA